MRTRYIAPIVAVLCILGVLSSAGWAQPAGQSDTTGSTPSEAVGGQSRESMAVDATAAQWSYQFAYEGFYDYRTDPGPSGFPRGKGIGTQFQFRLVAPFPKSEKMPLTLLPRLTLRLVENAAGTWGSGGGDIFVLGILQQWATGRWGLGPQLNFPSADGFGNPNWGFGLAGAVTQRAINDKLFLAFLLQQVWGKQGSSDVVVAGPISLNPIVVFQLGKGVYIGNGDFVIRYNWHDQSWFVPLQVRLGKAFISPTKTYNVYIEYATSVVYDDWTPPVATHAVRVNFQFQVPI